jgi:phosphoenolpyruvate synthase/pyruvate phosphate dikinase
MQGKFVSIANIDVNDKQALKKSIEMVINSFGKDKKKNDEIFVQPMLKNVTMSGVIFSCDIDTLSPYFVINYDESGSTNSVTSGISNDLKSFVCFKENNNIKNKKLEKIIKASKECEKKFLIIIFLDIEFAFSDDQLYIFQVRAIVTNNKRQFIEYKFV